MKFHHVGYLVENLDEAVNEFQILGYEVKRKKIFDEARRVYLCFMENNGLVVELVCPAEDCKLFSKLAKRIGNAPYHICNITEGGGGTISEVCEELQKRGFIMVLPPEPAKAFNGKSVAFMMGRATGLMEILEA